MPKQTNNRHVNIHGVQCDLTTDVIGVSMGERATITLGDHEIASSRVVPLGMSSVAVDDAVRRAQKVHVHTLQQIRQSLPGAINRIALPENFRVA